MKSISRTEFRDNLKKYFDLAEKECIIIHKGVKKAYILMPLSVMDETEFLKASPSNIVHLKKGIKEFNREDYARPLFKKRINIYFTPTAAKDYAIWREKKDKRIMAGLHRLLADVALHPQTGMGNPQCLKAEFSGFWSRAINTEHRVVYKKRDNGQIIVVGMYYQYEEEA